MRPLAHVMAGLVPAIPMPGRMSYGADRLPSALVPRDQDGRVEPGHDNGE